jgi:hypothetical protein
VRIRPPVEGADKLRSAIKAQLDPGDINGIISMHLMESDPRL